MQVRISALAPLMLLGSCGSNTPAKVQPNIGTVEQARYVSADRHLAMTFSSDGFRFGNAAEVLRGAWPAFPADRVSATNGVKCISIGPLGSGESFAIKRPIRVGESYSCRGTKFRVRQCFLGCKTAIIDRETPASGDQRPGVMLLSQMIVDACSGLLVFSQDGNLQLGIPLTALLLRSQKGVLADDGTLECSTS